MWEKLVDIDGDKYGFFILVCLCCSLNMTYSEFVNSSFDVYSTQIQKNLQYVCSVFFFTYDSSYFELQNLKLSHPNGPISKWFLLTLFDSIFLLLLKGILVNKTYKTGIWHSNYHANLQNSRLFLLHTKTQCPRFKRWITCPPPFHHHPLTPPQLLLLTLSTRKSKCV